MEKNRNNVICSRETKKIQAGGISLKAVLFFLLLLAGCDDIFEKDISDKSVELYAPSSGLVTGSTEIIFSWSPVDGASGYNFQLVSPSYDQPYELVADSVLSETSLTLSLDSAKYAWRVKAENSAYETPFSEPSVLTIGDEE